MKINKGLIGLSPLLFFVLFYLTASLIAGDFSKVPVVVAFFFATIYAVAITKGLSLPDRVRTFGRGAGTTKVIFMLSIFFIAGAFAKSAEAMGCIDETVNALLTILPSNLVYLSIFVAGCFISFATGSGLGSIVAVGPIAVGVAEACGTSMPLMCANVVCGAIFGDNLSFISDTTIIATTTQGCQPKDKFRMNLRIALPAAIVTAVVYLLLGRDMQPVAVPDSVHFIKIIPYLLVIILSVLGCDVLVLLLSGTAICGIMGMVMGDFDFYGWLSAIEAGINEMGPLAIIFLMASGLMALVKYNGGLDFLINVCQRFVHGRRSAEFCIALLSALVCACTSNNTIAIISVAQVSKELADKYGVDPRRAASLLDTSSCIMLELLPYSTHLLAAAAFAGISAAKLIPYVFYPFALLLFLILMILIGERKPKAKQA